MSISTIKPFVYLMSMNKDVIWLIRGSQRKELFLNIPPRSFLPNKVRKELNEKSNTNLSLREVSRHLKDFKKKNLIRCLNSSDPYNLIYELTSQGKKIQKDLSQLRI